MGFRAGFGVCCLIGLCVFVKDGRTEAPSGSAPDTSSAMGQIAGGERILSSPYGTMPAIQPDPRIDYKIQVICPDPRIDYKIRGILDPPLDPRVRNFPRTGPRMPGRFAPPRTAPPDTSGH